MTNDDTDNYEPEGLLTDQQREAQLWNLYDLLLTALVREVAKPGVRASTLEVGRQFLRDNEVSLDRSPDVRQGLALLLGKRDMPFKH